MKTKSSTMIGKIGGSMAIFVMGGVAGFYLNNSGLLKSEANVSTVVVCHQEAGQNPRNMVISVSALQGHLQHGDQLGGCLTANPASETKIR